MSIPWLDVAIAAIIILFALYGMKEGLIKTAMKFVVVIMSFVSAKMFSSKLAELLKEKSGIYSFILEKVSGKINPNGEGTGSIIDKVTNSTNQALAENTAKAIYTILCFVAVFIVSWIVLKIVSMIIEKIADLPVIKAFDQAGGLLVGVAKGLILVVILTNALYYLNMLINVEAITKLYDASFLMPFLYITSIYKMIKGE